MECMTFPEQLIRVLLIQSLLHPLALSIGREWPADIGAFIPLETQPFERFKNLLLRCTG
jgi:hypothetical protein